MRRGSRETVTFRNKSLLLTEFTLHGQYLNRKQVGGDYLTDEFDTALPGFWHQVSEVDLEFTKEYTLLYHSYFYQPRRIRKTLFTGTLSRAVSSAPFRD